LGIFVVLARDGVTRGTADVPGDMLTRKPERVINFAVDLMNILLPCATLKGEENEKKLLKKNYYYIPTTAVGSFFSLPA
jgi:hypothetical protein